MNPYRLSVGKYRAYLVCTIIPQPITEPGTAQDTLHFILTVMAYGRNSEVLHLPNSWEQSAFDLGLSQQRGRGKTPIPVLAVALSHCVDLDLPHPSLGLSLLKSKSPGLGYTVTKLC